MTISQGASIIGAQTSVNGTLVGDEDLHVLGRVEGGIDLGGNLLVDTDAVVVASVQARQAVIHGSVVGDVVAAEFVQISASGRVLGDISAPRVAIDDGAQYSGRIEMSEEAPEPARPARPVVETRRPMPPRRTRTKPAAEPVVTPTPAARAVEEAPTPSRSRKKPAAKAPAKKTSRSTTTKPKRKPPKPPTKAGKKARTRRK